MGCSSSKSTPTVESNPAETMEKTIMENGKSILMNVENKIDDLKDGVHNAAAKLESTLLSSPATERAGGNVDDGLADCSEDVTGSEATDSETNAMSLQTDNQPDDSDGLLNNDKPPTPMPETCSLSDVTLCNESDTEKQQSECENESDEKQSECGDNNCDTLNSNIFKAVCTTAASVAMQDTDTDDCPQSMYNSDSSRSNTITSRYSQNSLKTNYRPSDKCLSESDGESEVQSYRRRRSAGCDSQKINNETYVRLGRQFCKDFEYCNTTSKTQMVQNANRGCCSAGRTLNIKGSMQLSKNNKSVKL